MTRVRKQVGGGLIWVISRFPISLALLSAASFLLAAPFTHAQKLQLQSKTAVGTGWYPWYEVKADPDNALNLILCGSSWDTTRNALFGFVYASTDGGKAWRVALEDRSTTWVSETSCAFGSGHTAYFISEASKVIDGVAHHHLGTTRLFVSTDGGQQWVESSRTAWADYSTSAVSAVSGTLFTFYNNSGTHDVEKNWGSTIGLLKFSPDGRTVSGPFLDPTMKERNYVGVFPSHAVALRDGTVAALFFGARDTQNGREYDLGLERAGLSPSSPPTFNVIASTKKCLNLDGFSLAYDVPNENLFVAYGEEAGAGCRLMLAVSRDAGKTWVSNVLLNSSGTSRTSVDHVSLARGQDGTLGLLWEDSGNWRFATGTDSAVVDPPVELVSEPKEVPISNDSLMTVIYEPGEASPEGSNSGVTTSLNVRAMTGVVWRSSGLIASRNVFYAFSPTVVLGGEGLFLTVLSAKGGSDHPANQAGLQDIQEQDVTKQTVLLYGRAQSFNKATGTLSVDLRLGNRGDTPIRSPIRLKVKQISSRAGKVSILNADNGLTGSGAMWDVSEIVLGDQIAPGATTYNTFRLSFHIEQSTGAIPTYNLLDAAISVLAASSAAGTRK